MTFYSKVGSFTAPAGAGYQSTTGVGFTPKAIIFWYGAVSNSSGAWHGGGTSYTGGNASGMGFVTASGSGAVGLTEYINAPDDIYNCHSATAIYCYTLAGTLSASLSSLDSDGFTLYWPSTISGVTIHYLALGGTDITGAMVKTWTAKGSTGSQSITGVGFKPSVVINIGTSDTSGPPHVSAGTAWGPIDSGAMDGSGNQWARSDRFYNNCNRYELTNACIVGVDVNTGVDYQAAYTSMDSDGFTINWSKCAAAAYFYSLCLTGGSYQVGNWVKSTSAASDTITLGITPQAIFVESACMTATSSSINNEMRMFGASDGTNNHVVTTTYDVSGAYQYWDTTNSILIPATHNTTGTIGTLGSFASSQFVASYSTYDSVATEICYIAFSAASTGYTAYPAVISVESQPIIPPFTIDHTNTPTVISPEAAPIVPPFTISCSLTSVVAAAECTPINAIASLSAQLITTTVVATEAQPIDIVPSIVVVITTTVALAECNPVGATAPISAQVLTTTVVASEARENDPSFTIDASLTTTVVASEAAPISIIPSIVVVITTTVVEPVASVVDPTAPISLQTLTTVVVAIEAREIDPSFTIDCSLTLTVNETEIYAVDVSDIVIWSGTFVADFNLDERTDLKVYGIAQKSDGSPYPLDGVTIEWNMRDKHGTILVTKSTSDGSIMIEDSASGMFSFNLTTTDTDFNLEPTYERPAVCRQEARIIDGSNQFVGLRGRAFIMPTQT